MPRFPGYTRWSAVRSCRPLIESEANLRSVSLPAAIIVRVCRFKIGLSLDVDGSGLDDLAAATFAIRLHADVCGVGGGLTYQNP